MFDCCENYAGKLFLVFGLTCKKPIFRKGKHKSAPSHHLVATTKEKHNPPPTTQNPDREEEKNCPHCSVTTKIHQNTTTHTTTITTKSEIKEKEYQTQKYVGGLVRVREKKWEEKMKTSVEKGGRMRPIKERDGEIVPDRAMAVVDRVHAEVEEVFDWSVVRWSEKMRETIWPRGRWQQDREEMIWPRGGQGDLEGGGDDQTQFKKREWSVMGGSWATRPVKRWQASCGTISAAQSWQRDLEGAILPVCLGLGRDLTHSLYSLFLLFLSLSLSWVFVSPKMIWR